MLGQKDGTSQILIELTPKNDINLESHQWRVSVPFLTDLPMLDIIIPFFASLIGGNIVFVW